MKVKVVPKEEYEAYYKLRAKRVISEVIKLIMKQCRDKRGTEKTSEKIQDSD